MRTIVMLFVVVMSASQGFCQQKAIKIVNEEKGREIVIKEHKRVKLRTVNGEKIKGRFSIKDDQTISIDGQEIQLDEILFLKRNQLLLNILTGGTLVFLGALTSGIGVIVGIFIQPSGYLLTIPGAAMIYAGLKTPNLGKNYKSNKKWKYEIIQIE